MLSERPAGGGAAVSPPQADPRLHEQAATGTGDDAQAASAPSSARWRPKSRWWPTTRRSRAVALGSVQGGVGALRAGRRGSRRRPRASPRAALGEVFQHKPRGLRLAGECAHHVQRHDVSRALPDRIHRCLAVDARQRKQLPCNQYRPGIPSPRRRPWAQPCSPSTWSPASSGGASAIGALVTASVERARQARTPARLRPPHRAPHRQAHAALAAAR